MGDMVTVSIAAVDLSKRRMDLLIADAEGRAVGKSKKLKLDSVDGGLGSSGGAGFGSMKTPGATRRSRKSKSRDKAKKDYRRDRKK
jgi:hypothetical protein